MRREKLPDDLNSEFQEFINTPPQDVPAHLSRSILARVHDELNPSPSLVFTKLVSIVFLVGLMNLTLCPQFGIGPVRHTNLMHFFMSFGEYGCRVACGVFFLGSALLLASFLLRPEDINVIRRSRLLFISTMSAGSLIAFVALGGDVYFEAAAFWLLGSVIGGLLSIEIGWSVRRWALA